MKKIIGFDLDGVIVSHFEAKIRIAKKFGYTLDAKQTPASLIKKIIPKGPYEKLQEIIYDHPVIALKPPLMRGIKTCLDRLKKNKISFVLISRRESPETPIKLLKKHKLWPKYFNATNVHFVKERRDKNTKAIELGVTHYIDDEPEVLVELVNVRNRFLFDPLDIFKKTSYKKIRSWSEFDF